LKTVNGPVVGAGFLESAIAPMLTTATATATANEFGFITLPFHGSTS
jgi:hypothetical protein